MTVTIDDDEMTRRAMAAYFRETSHMEGVHPIPSNSSGVTEVDGRSYVLLLTGDEVLRVYRIRPDGTLRRLRRPPRELGE